MALCPHCKAAEGERISRRMPDVGGVVVTFECPNCENEWDVGF